MCSSISLFSRFVLVFVFVDVRVFMPSNIMFYCNPLPLPLPLLHVVIVPFFPLYIIVTLSYIVILSYCHIVISLSYHCHIIVISLSYCHFVILSFCHIVILSYCQFFSERESFIHSFIHFLLL
jgi:hypothetical protein